MSGANASPAGRSHQEMANRIPLLAASFWCAGILAAPFLNLPLIYDFFAAICHQDPARSWSLAGNPLPVCIRCASIYFGFLAALAAGTSPRLRWLQIAIVFTVAEFVAARVLIDSPLARSLTGMLLGAAAAPFVRQGMVELLGRRRLRESV